MKKLLLLLLIVCITLMFSGCYDIHTYYGYYPELSVVATESLINVSTNHKELILPLEQDEYGRRMFAFMESEGYDCISILVCQESTAKYSYFYDNKNFILKELDNPDNVKDLTRDLVEKLFSTKEIEKLKEENDWDEPRQPEKYFGVRISKTKNIAVNAAKKDRIFKELPTELQNSQIVYFLSDKNDKSIYCLYNDADAYFLMTGTFDIPISGTGLTKINDKINYREQLKEFKEKNGWCSFSYADES